jgi:hypothetical protein
MAERRMFAKTIVLSDAFLDMPLSARCLYFTLGMLADDDGFVNNPKSVMRQVGASNDDINILIAKRFIITFDSGVIVIKHWRIHNYIQKDRYKKSKYIEEKASLMLDDKGAYTENNTDVSILDTQDRLGKDSKGIDNKSILSNSAELPDSPKEQNESINSEFESLWILYPRKIGKQKAFNYYSKARKKGTTFEEVKQGILNYKAEIEKKKTEMRFVKHGSTWFNNYGWKDEYEAPKEPTRYGGTYL